MDAPLVYLSKLILQKAHVFSDPGPSINPLLVLITKMNGIIVVIGLQQQFMPCKKSQEIQAYEFIKRNLSCIKSEVPFLKLAPMPPSHDSLKEALAFGLFL